MSRLAFPLLLLGVLLALATPATAKGSLSKVEDEFEKAIQKVTPATCVCLAWGVDSKKILGGSSGVIMSRKGLVLSDGDVGLWFDIKKGQRGVKPGDRRWSDDVEIRLPDLKGKGFKSFRAKVIKRDKGLDTTLMRMEKPPNGLKFLKAGNSDALRVGDFAFAMGNSFGLAAEAPPTLTAGVIASLVPQRGSKGGKYRHIYTSAAVNPGVNGGPLVDIHGHLVGTVSSTVSLVDATKGPDHPEKAYAYLGKIVPIQRLKELYKDLPESEELFQELKGGEPRSGESAALATVFHHTGRRAHRAVVGLKINRKGQLSLAEPGGRGGQLVNIPRYLGPVSGVLVSQDGYVLTSLYNLANIATLVHRGWVNAPENVKVKAGLEGIEKITVYLPDGRKVPAKVVAYHEGIGIVLIKADVKKKPGESTTVTSFELLEPANKAALKPGRFVIAVGSPFGLDRLEDPLLTVGVLSKLHAEGIVSPWGGQWQTDAGVTDANCGGAAVDIRGRLLGLMSVWSSTMHGRNSGIGFVIPWTQIEPALGEMKRGKSFRRPFMGVSWRVEDAKETTSLAVIVPDSAASKAGIKVGDQIIKVDGEVTATADDVRRLLRGKWAGDEIVLTIRRLDEELEIKFVLGARE